MKDGETGKRGDGEMEESNDREDPYLDSHLEQLSRHKCRLMDERNFG
jgi:hypothetical protein